MLGPQRVLWVSLAPQAASAAEQLSPRGYRTRPHGMVIIFWLNAERRVAEEPSRSGLATRTRGLSARRAENLSLPLNRTAPDFVT